MKINFLETKLKKPKDTSNNMYYQSISNLFCEERHPNRKEYWLEGLHVYSTPHSRLILFYKLPQKINLFLGFPNIAMYQEIAWVLRFQFPMQSLFARTENQVT